MAPSHKQSLSKVTKNCVIKDFSCGKCTKIVRNGILCESCDRWFHFEKCSKVEELNVPKREWSCATCVEHGDVPVEERKSNNTSTSQEHHTSQERVIQTLTDEIAALKEVINILKEQLSAKHPTVQGVCNMEDRTFTPVVAKNKMSRTQNRATNPHHSTVPTKNRFSIFSNLDHFPPLQSPSTSTGKNQNAKNSLKQDRPNSSRSDKPGNHNLNKPHKQNRCSSSVFLLGDSHGKGIAEAISDCNRAISAIGLTKPGAPLNEILKSVEEDPNVEEDFVVIIGGANDVAKNKGAQAASCLEDNLKNLQHKNVIVVNIPTRYDLIDNSCVNVAIKETNISYEKVCKKFSNVSCIDISNIDENMHTRHGLHLNKKGKALMAEKICDVINSVHCKFQSRKPTFLDKWLICKADTSKVVSKKNKLPKKLTFLDKWVANGNNNKPKVINFLV